MSPGGAPHVVVLGGGSAGWITACLLHQAWAPKGGTVTVVESPDIGIIGVGEGSTPQLKAFFDHLGIAEAAWMPACDATYKLGIRFTGWGADQSGSYFHPFPGPVDLHTEPAFARNCALRRRAVDVPAHPDDWFLAARLADERRGPHPAPGFPFPPSYGYHFDAYKLGAFLRDWAAGRGVIHRPLRMVEVEHAANGDIAALLCEGGERIAGDVFVDCSGFAGLLARRALGGRFLSFSENLFNDRAVVMPTSHGAALHPQTDSIAMRAGWRWAIPLTSRVGNGYVYSSRHIDDDAAAAELNKALGVGDDAPPPRFLKMEVGRLEDSWSRNCLASGLAQGFIEPLEATALHIVIATALDFVAAYEAGDDGARGNFNARTAARYEGIRDYIVGHYRLNRRTDTDYWRENAANNKIPGGLKAMMTAWFTHEDIGAANRAIYGDHPPYAPMSWLCLFAGYGAFPAEDRLQAAPPGLGADRNATRTLLGACASNFAPYAPV